MKNEYKYECKLCGKNSCKIDQYLCDSCQTQVDKDGKRIEELEAQGHSSHCACRQVWGDGECECKIRPPEVEG